MSVHVGQNVLQHKPLALPSVEAQGQEQEIPKGPVFTYQEQVFTTDAIIVKIDESKGPSPLALPTGWCEPNTNYSYYFKATLADMTGGVIMTCFSPEENSMLPAITEVLSYTPDPDPHVLPSIIRDLENRKRTICLHFATCCRRGYPKLILDSAADAPPPMLPAVPRSAHEATTSSTVEPLAEEIPTEMITPPPTHVNPSITNSYKWSSLSIFNLLK